MRLFVFILCSWSLVIQAQTIAKDPTRPPKFKSQAEIGGMADSGTANKSAEQSAGLAGARLSAIVYSEGVKYAIINNQIVNEGEKWNNATLAQVLPDRVILKTESQQKELTLLNTKIILEKNYEN